jgi:mannose-6-phosphate isomerase-like protein (cupin superfamily)
MIVTIDEAPLENQETAQGWSISEFRLPLVGPGFAVFHGRFREGSRHSVHRHLVSDELCVYLSGRGLVGTGADRYTVGPGDSRLMPASISHYFHNSGTDGIAEVLGLYVGAQTVAKTGYELVGPISSIDLELSERAAGPIEFPFTPAGSGEVVDQPCWELTEWRRLVASDVATAFSATVEPGGGYAGSHTAHTVYFVAEGMCEVDRERAQAGDIWHRPPSEPTTLSNPSGDRPLRIYGFQVSPIVSSVEREDFK